MAVSVLLSWREGVSLGTGEGGSLRVEGPGSRLTFRRPSPAFASALGRLDAPGEEEDRLAGAIFEADGASGLPGWYYHLRSLDLRGWIVRSAWVDGRKLASLIPTSADPSSGPAAVDLARPVVLSRFAYLRRSGGGAVLESPRAHARVVFDDPRAASIVGALATPGDADELASRVEGLAPDAVAALLKLMAGAGMVGEAGPDGPEEGPSLKTWEFHDLLFHARSRKGRTDGPSGATYRFAGIDPPPPALGPESAGDSIALDRPDLERLGREDPPLSAVVEARRSIREYDDRPIDSRQLGEFLYRVARVTGRREIEVETPVGPLTMEFAYRPYPSGGALYELEFYLAINRAGGLEPGLYRYEAGSHRLRRVAGRTAEVEHLLSDGAASAGIPPDRVQVLVILAARFARLAWKYESIAYALILKHVGAAYQTMYLAATAMGLAPCALGGGDSDRFARAAGTDSDSETSVGEFLLGSDPAGRSTKT